MATIVAYNTTKSLEIEENTTVDGSVDVSGNLILERRNGTTFNAGSVGAPTGDQGPERPLAPGQITLYGGSVAPQGWAFCDGAAVSRINFPDLFSVIGTQYGAGDGTTTFNLPNLKGRVPIGFDSAQTEFNTLAKLGGAKTHVLTTPELPAHTHTILGYKNVDDRNFTGNDGRLNASDTAIDFPQSTGNTGGGGAHNNLQPYFTINYIMSLGIAGFEGGGIAKNRYFKDTGRGTTAQRNTRFGTPSTTAAHVALANQKVVWYNTDLGWEESYYVATGTAGLTALGLVTGAVSGWYPIGEGPTMVLEATTDFYVTFPQLIGNFGIQYRKGGATWFTTTGNNLIQVLKHGRYDVRAWTQMQEGPGAPDYFLQVLGSDGTTVVKGVSGGGFTKDSLYWTRPHQEAYDVEILAGQQVGFKLQQGTMGSAGMTVHVIGTSGVRGRMVVKYVGPPLVTE